MMNTIPAEIQRAFEEATAKREIVPPPGGFIADGEWHRADTADVNGKGDASYVLDKDGLAGAFENHKDLLGWETWRYDGNGKGQFTEEDHKRWAAFRKKFEKKKAKDQVDTADRARRFWDKATPAPSDHPYLVEKKISVNSLKYWNQTCELLVPMRDAEGKLWNLQLISARKAKDGKFPRKFLKGGRTTEIYYQAGPEPKEIVAIGEGVVTMLSVHEATGHSTVAAMSAGNLLAVGKALRAKFPEAQLIYIADHDKINPKTGKRIGVEKATEAARATGGLLAVPQREGDDANDLFVRDGAEAVRALLDSARSPQAPEVLETTSEINVALPLQTATAAAWRALIAANAPPRFFRYSGLPCRLEQDDRGNPITVHLNPDRMRHELARAARWIKIGKYNLIDVSPPMDVVRDVLATPNLPLPLLSRIVTAPVFSPDGALQTVPGYHEAGKIYYFPDGMSVPDVQAVPSVFDLNRAREIILELLVDFNFVGDSDRAHAIALLLLPFVRDMIDGSTPNHLVEAPTPGSGKGLLADVCLTPALGKSLATIPETKSDEEIRKRITAFLLRGVPAVVLDNVTGALNSGAWSSALTATVWKDRRLGKSEDVQIPVRNVWVTTGNNVTMTTEIARRSIRIRLDPKCDRPWQREDFRHPDLRGWAKENRPRLVWAALTLAQAWIAAGRPAPACKLLGSFEEWTRVIGGILNQVGISGFLANADDFYEAADTEASAWTDFVKVWYEKFQSKKVTAKDLLKYAYPYFVFKEREDSHALELGQMLRKKLDSVIASEYVVSSPKGTVGGKRVWQVLRSSKAGQGGLGGSGGFPPLGLDKHHFFNSQKLTHGVRGVNPPNPPKTPFRLVGARPKRLKLRKKAAD